MSDPDARLARLQLRLTAPPRAAWERIGVASGHTLVALPSIDFGEAFAQRGDVPALEERWLYLLLLLRRPHMRVALVTSLPVDPGILDYELSAIGSLPDPGDRLGVFTVGDPGPRSLAAKLLDRPDVVAEIGRFVGSGPASILPFAALGAAERDLALALDVPLLGIDARFAGYATKSGSRRLLAAADVAIPTGVSDVRGADAVVTAVTRLRRADPWRPGAVVKLEDGVTGSGNAVVSFAGLPDIGSVDEQAAIAARLAEAGDAYVAALDAGAVVEELIDAVASPSVQIRIEPGGDVEPIATHDQVLGGPLGQSYVGCRFPAVSVTSAALVEPGVRVGHVLAAEGAVGRFAVDFVVDRVGRARAVEVNPREGATSHPHGTLVLLGAGARHLRASDGVPAAGPATWRDAVALVDEAGLAWDPAARTGVALSMLGGLQRTHRLSVTAIGTSAEHADQLFDQTRDALRHERNEP